MKGKKILSFVALCFLLLIMMPSEASAKSQVTSGTLDFICDYYAEDIDFYLYNNTVLYCTFDISTDLEAEENSGVVITLEGTKETDYVYNNEVIFKESFECTIPEGEQSVNWWYYPDEALPEGYYTLSVEALDDNIYECKYKISAYEGFAEYVEIPTNLSMKTEAETTIELTNITPSDSLVGAVVTSSDPKSLYVYNDGTEEIYLKALKAGEVTLSVELKNGETFTRTVTITNPSPKLKYK